MKRSRLRRLSPLVAVSLTLAIWIASVLSLAEPAGAYRTASRRQLPTTAPLNATGPEDPEGGVYGLIRPRRFMLAAVPFSFGFTTGDARWFGWGSPAAIGRGDAEFNVIMSLPKRVSYTMVLSRRRLIRCQASRDHYSYEKVAIHIPDYAGTREDFSEPMHAGCSSLRTRHS